MNLIGHVCKVNSPAETLIGHFREAVEIGQWPAVILHSVHHSSTKHNASHLPESVAIIAWRLRLCTIHPPCNIHSEYLSPSHVLWPECTLSPCTQCLLSPFQSTWNSCTENCRLHGNTFGGGAIKEVGHGCSWDSLCVFIEKLLIRDIIPQLFQFVLPPLYKVFPARLLAQLRNLNPI